jgi:predicted AlkP superfamily phosphohydrolase/phosphomutase
MSVLMIGLDGATYSLLDPLAAQGIMPFLGRLMRAGVRGDLTSTRNPLTPPAWTSMITGVSPEQHGVHDFLRPEMLADGGVFLKINDFRDNRAETIWSIANRGGRRATSLNFFGMSPPPEIEGYVISGFVPWRHLRHGTHPKSLFDRIKAMPGLDYRNLGMDIGQEKKCIQGLVDGEREDWILLQGARDTAWADLACTLMEEDRTELTAVVLDGPDKVQHLFWRFVDPDYEEPDPETWFERVRALCLDYYRQLDRNIERLITAAGPETDVLMVSDHGFGPTTEIVYLNEWLARRGYLAWTDAAAVDESGKLTADRIKDHLRIIDWKRTTAFCPTPRSNAIYVKPDRGSGAGVKEEDYAEFCLALKRELLDYRDPRSGEAVFVGVDANKLRGSSYVGACPDLTVRLRDGGFVSILKSSEVVVPRKRPDGTHRPNGIFIGHGPHFRKGETIAPIDVVDMTPLMLNLLGIAVPRDLEGAVPVAALTSVADAAKTGAATVASANPGEDRDEPTEEERQALMTQLRTLGYME